jgi:hypothetical protein
MNSLAQVRGRPSSSEAKRIGAYDTTSPEWMGTSIAKTCVHVCACVIITKVYCTVVVL